jgi:ATP-binding cassette subfamily B protein
MLETLCWPASRAAEGLEALARAASLPVRPRATAIAAEPSPGSHRDVPRAATSLGLDVEPVETTCGDVDAFLRSAGPAVVQLPGERLVMVVRRHRRTVKVVTPEHRTANIPIALLRRSLVEPFAAPLTAEIEQLVGETDTHASRRAAVVLALVNERLRGRTLAAGWMVRVPSASSFGAQLVAIGARRQLVLLTAAHVGQYALWILAWWLLGRAALQGRVDSTWLMAFTLALVSLIPLQLAALWLQGRLALRAGALLKQRLLAGAFHLEPEEIRREGAGQLLGRVLEANAVESLALGGGFMALLAALELIIAGAILTLAAPLIAVLLLLWLAAVGAITAVYFKRRLGWARVRVALTHGLIERILGHRTRLAQQPREQWHDGEDEALERYVRASAAMDRAAVWLLAVIPRGWMVVALCGLAPMFASGGSAASLAVALGAIVLTFRALDRLTGGLWNLTGAGIAWRQTAPVFRAASRATLDPSARDSRDIAAPANATLEATELRFAHAGRHEPVLRGCSLTLAPGERVRLQGASGGGKSTLASLLAGMRTPQSGLLLLDGLDRHTIGLNAWRRRVVVVPQFHENHLVLGSVAFNVLMGSGWPPTSDDFVRAEAVLRELGLGETLDRMPSGLLQMTGETGWQLSHGERGRLFLARALLQNPDVLILDESFAQLDPANVHRALDVVGACPSAVLLIAHP